MNRGKKLVAAAGMVAVAAGVGGATVGAADAASPAPATYHWYKVSWSSDSSPSAARAANQSMTLILQAESVPSSPNHDVMATKTLVRESGKTNSTLYYRAKTPFAGGIVANSEVAYNAWKAAPDQMRDIAYSVKDSDPAKGQFTYLYWASPLKNAYPSFHYEVVRGPHWA